MDFFGKNKIIFGKNQVDFFAKNKIIFGKNQANYMAKIKYIYIYIYSIVWQKFYKNGKNKNILEKIKIIWKNKNKI